MRIKTTRPMIRSLISTALLLILTAASHAQQTSSETTKQAAPPSGAITGRVVSSGGDPVTAATVYLSVLGVSGPGRSTMVDASGSFKIDGLDAGAFSMGVSAPGFYTEPPAPPNDQRQIYHLGDSVTFTMMKGGVITGTVTTSTNTPVVNANVRAFRVRDEKGEPLQGSFGPARERLTDDRGVYRLYGLLPGSYVISAGGPGRGFTLGGNQYDSDVPTYAPSSTRDTAVEISVRSGEEITADIQYRGEPGHSVSGTLTGLTQGQSTLITSATISITEVGTHTTIMSTNTSSYTGYAFAFYGIGDGEYELYAQRYTLPPGDASASEARRVKVQGTDLAGINLNLMPLASIAGRLVLESTPPLDCVKGRSTAAQETLISAHRFTQEIKPPARPGARAAATPTVEVPLNLVNQNAGAVPDLKGDFTLHNLQPGSYRIDPQPAGAGWYLRSITIGSPAAAKPSDPNIARDGITLKKGERVSGLTVTFTEGAAGLRGRISVAEGQRVPPGLRVYLVPAEREARENVLRFFDAAAAESDAGFAIANIAPGRYWIIARPADDGDPKKVKPIRQESALRARVLREGESAKKEISFKPCEQAADYDLPYSLPAPLPSEPKP